MAASQASKLLPWSRCSGNGAVHGVFFHGVGDVHRALFLVLQGAVGEIRPAAHEGVGQVRPLQDRGGAEHLVDFDHCLGLAHGVDVERPLGVIISFGGVQNGFHWDQRHSNFLLIDPVADLSYCRFSTNIIIPCRRGKSKSGFHNISAQGGLPGSDEACAPSIDMRFGLCRRNVLYIRQKDRWHFHRGAGVPTV